MAAVASRLLQLAETLGAAAALPELKLREARRRWGVVGERDGLVNN